MSQIAAHVLTPTQTQMIWALLAQQGYAAQNSLGVPVDASECEELEAEHLITTLTREQNALWLKLEDVGWDWAEAHLTKSLPPHQLVLHHMMVRIDAHLKAKGETLVELIGKSPKVGPMDPELTDVVDA